MRLTSDCIAGCLVGGAIGDALGGVRERGALSISDDTQLTLATCEAIEAAGRVSPEAVAANFLAWFRAERITGVGSSTLKALRDLSAGAHWALCGARGERAAGNGAAMRIAPLAFALDARDPSHRVTVRDVCRITHHSDEAYVGALAVLVAIQSPAWSPAPSFFGDLAGVLPDSSVRDRLLAFAGVPGEAPLHDVIRRFGSSGYVVETVPLAIFVAARLTTETFEETLTELAELAADADTIASIAGQIAGAHLGYSRLPRQSLELAPVQAIIPAAKAFAAKLAGGKAATG